MDARTAVDVLEARGDDESFGAAKRALDAALAEGEDSKRQRAGSAPSRTMDPAPTLARTSESLREARSRRGSGENVALGHPHDVIDRYERRIVHVPDDLLAHRCLAQAYVAAGRWEEAAATIEAGRRLAPEDAVLLDVEGSLLAGTGRPDEALAVWQRALELDTTSIGPHYSRAFLLERLGRVPEAEAEWEAIIAWSRASGSELDTKWPQSELARLRG